MKEQRGVHREVSSRRQHTEQSVRGEASLAAHAPLIMIMKVEVLVTVKSVLALQLQTGQGYC